MPRNAYICPPVCPEEITDAQLLGIVCRRPGISLREVCAELAPRLPWLALRKDDQSASETVQGDGRTLAQTVLEQLEVLAVGHHVRFTPRRRDEVDALAGVAVEAIRYLSAEVKHAHAA